MKLFSLNFVCFNQNSISTEMVTTVFFASEYVQNNLCEFVYPFCELFLVFVCQHAILSVPCSLLVTWERADLLTRLCV